MENIDPDGENVNSKTVSLYLLTVLISVKKSFPLQNKSRIRFVTIYFVFFMSTTSGD